MQKMRAAPFCAAVDWGTSSFRAWLLSADGTVLSERRAADGLSQIAPGSFELVLEGHLAEFGAPADLPVVVCGMAGARQGWIEAPYAATPARFPDLAAEALRVPGLDREVRILPGVAQRDPQRPDVMRGEETQLAGLGVESDALACLPGTHSKWAAIEAGALARFSTFMTGELFDLLARTSILRHSLGGDLHVSPDDETFLSAVREARADPGRWTGRLFGLRAGDLLGLQAPPTRAPWLSGSLIGIEIAGGLALHPQAREIALVASGRLADLYAGAFEACGLAHRRIDAETAVRAGLLTAARHFWPARAEASL